MIHRRHFAAAAAAQVLLPLGARASSRATLGLSLPLTGIQAANGLDLLAGYKLAASIGGFNLETFDDEGDPRKTAENIKRLADSESVIAASGIVGTPNALAALPVAMAADLPVVGIRSGAAELRTGRGDVFHFRASYDAELERMAQHLHGAGVKKVEILFADDAFGRPSQKTLAAALARLKINMGEPVAVSRNGEDLSAGVAKVAGRVKTDITYTAIVLLLISKPMQEAAKQLREQHRVVMPLYAMSHVANKEVMIGRAPFLAGLGIMLAFPLPRRSMDQIARHYREAATRAGAFDMMESLSSFEGFFYGSIFAQAVKDAGSVPGRAQIASAVRKGLVVDGQPLKLSPSNEGFRFLDVAYKNAGTGRLYT